MSKIERRKDYHSYVFAEGKLIGKFEEMYKNSINIPWHQNEVNRFHDIKLSKIFLDYKAPYKSLIEVGCGYGYFLNEISSIVSIPKNAIGIDISKTAISKARLLFPQFTFCQGDITKQNFKNKFRATADLVVIRGFFWYVYDKMDIVPKNIRDLVQNGGFLFIHQNFPPLDKAFVGKDVIPNPSALTAFFAPHFETILRNDFDIAEKNANDFWVSMLMRKRPK